MRDARKEFSRGLTPLGLVSPRHRVFFDKSRTQKSGFTEETRLLRPEAAIAAKL
ncbi:MAG TPA: hypothetical protein V6D26_09045 [Stenomitos sp.]